jgi:Mn2+/Fe2+ NRAMP family transporter
MLARAEREGTAAKLATYTRLSGPGWLQSAITLGGGSLASSLYLGVIGGYHMLWVQPLAMLLGIVMLSAIGYVTLTTQERPFPAINEHVNPVLGWGWALAVAAANIVWCLPQFALANGVLSQNLLPNLLGDGVQGPVGTIQQAATERLGSGTPSALFWGTYADEIIVAAVICLISIAVTWSYDRGGWGIRIYETMLKIVVGLIVLCFFGVVVRMAMSSEGLPWGQVALGFVPNFAAFTEPSPTFAGLLSAIGDVGTPARDYWQSYIVREQTDIIISAAATAVGINMTFLFAYSLLRKGWSKEFRGLVKFDLATGMLIPFLLATSCVVISSAARFHTEPPAGFEFEDGQVVVPEAQEQPLAGLIDARNAALSAGGEAAAPPSVAEQRLAAAVIRRDAFDLAKALTPVTGDFFAKYVFGFGVLAMTLSTITILMLISGFVVCELIGLPQGGWPHRIGTLLPALIGALGPILWTQASFYLAVPTSVFGFVLLPLAYLTFFLLMNQRSLLGADMPRGMRRVVWNALMFVSAGVATAGSFYMAYQKAGYGGLAAIVGILLLATVVHFNRRNTARYGNVMPEAPLP